MRQIDGVISEAIYYVRRPRRPRPYEADAVIEGIEVSRGFPKIGHSGSPARIVLEQNKFSKKLPLTGIEPVTLGL